MSEFELGLTLVLFAWSFGLAAIEIEIEGGVGWAERLPTWYLKRGKTGKVYGLVMGKRPLTGYHVYAFTIPMLILHLPYVSGVDWTLAGELRTIAIYFVVAVVWDYLWFVLNPAYTVQRFRRGNVWWFEVPWLWRFPRDYYLSWLLSIALAQSWYFHYHDLWAVGPQAWTLFSRNLVLLALYALLLWKTSTPSSSKTSRQPAFLRSRTSAAAEGSGATRSA